MLTHSLRTISVWFVLVGVGSILFVGCDSQSTLTESAQPSVAPSGNQGHATVQGLSSSSSTAPLLMTVMRTDGTVDNFSGPEPTSPRTVLDNWFSNAHPNGTLVQFDERAVNDWLLHSFASLPSDIVAATFEFKAKATNRTASSDGLRFFPQLNGPGNAGVSMNELIADATGGSDQTWSFRDSETFTVDLTSVRTSNILPTVNAEGAVDFRLQDDTMVDYVKLTVVAEVARLDIKPGSDPNAINPNSRGLIPVAILGSDGFDPADVDVNTARFGDPDDVDGGSGATAAHNGHLEDVNNDGYQDLVLHFPTRTAGFEGDENEGKLTAKTNAGDELTGTQSVKLVGTGGPGGGPPVGP